ncbi:MAG: hypothetical protein LBQ41_03665, partial [Candidatus Ancillula sp.]|nr:hypothetical protein [Candidatus Ancillula sp.]
HVILGLVPRIYANRSIFCVCRQKYTTSCPLWLVNLKIYANTGWTLGIKPRVTVEGAGVSNGPSA